MDATQEADELERLLQRGVRLPAQPQALIQLRSLLEADETDLRQLSQVIATDPGLMSMLFRLASSPAYGGRKIDSLQRVLQVVGLRQTGNLVCACALSNSMPAARQAIYERFWQRSLAIADFAAAIAADRVSVCNIFPDQAYLAAIFHDCGVPVLAERFPDYCDTLLARNNYHWADVRAEDLRFKADHCAVGYLVARHWRLPDFIAEAVRFHHDLPPPDHGGAARTMVAIIQLAIDLHYRENHTENPDWIYQRTDVAAELCIPEAEIDYYADDMLETALAA